MRHAPWRPHLRYALLLSLFLWPGSLLASPPTIHLDPAAPVFGKPLSIIIPVADAETILAGLPDLGAFKPLAPPLQTGKEIRLVVLPMRPGEQEIPPFPLQVGTSRQIETAALRVSVLEGVAQDAAIAPYKRRPFLLVGSGPGSWIAIGTIAGLVLGAAVTLFWHWWRRPRFEKLPRAAQLSWLRTRLLKLPASERRALLLAEIEERRFAPIPTHPHDIHRLHSELLSLIAGVR